MNRIITASFVRPADTNVYASGDVINTSETEGTVWSIPNAPITGSTGLIVSALLISSACQAVKLSSELWIFSVAPTPDNDNAPFTPTALELESLLGIIVFPTPYIGDATAGATGNVVYPASDMAKAFQAGSASQNDFLYGVLVPRNAYMPVSEEKFTLRLGVQGPDPLR